MAQDSKWHPLMGCHLGWTLPSPLFGPACLPSPIPDGSIPIRTECPDKLKECHVMQHGQYLEVLLTSSKGRVWGDADPFGCQDSTLCQRDGCCVTLGAAVGALGPPGRSHEEGMYIRVEMVVFPSILLSILGLYLHCLHLPVDGGEIHGAQDL